MSERIANLVIVGGGTAGWLAACVLAARRPELAITLVEAPDIPTIGVGEGSWPTLRETLRMIGIAEQEFLLACDASFKQGSRFDGWTTGAADDSYLHPFTPPPLGNMGQLLDAWREAAPGLDFAGAMTAQAATCAHGLAPRQRAMPDFAGAVNYGYHLDAGKFAALLRYHATNRLGVTHLSDRVVTVRGTPQRIESIELAEHGMLEGDFFLDCSGSRAILIQDHCGSHWIDRSDVSLNNSALAVQVPVEPGSPIASQTIGTAHQAGWLWDIALPTRRGIGCVYASRFLDDDDAERILRQYIAEKVPGSDSSSLVPRKLSFPTGYRERFWQGNCLAVGQSAGFIEPLEASAIVMIELSVRALAENFPASFATLPIHAERFNALFTYRWERIVDFLKLHYALSQREEPYWLAQRDPARIPQRLANQLALWREQPPSPWDFPQVDEVFSSASQQYVLYGMGFPVPSPRPARETSDAMARLSEVRERARGIAAALPTNRAYFDALAQSPTAALQGELARS